jgi:hypothetical protein
MPVPRRRKKAGVTALISSPSSILKVLDINLVFMKTRKLLWYSFAPGVILMGMYREPAPTSWFDLINIF